MWNRLSELRPIQNGLRRAGVHFAKAAYEIVGGVAAFVDELASAVQDEQSDDRDDPDSSGPTRIVVE